MRQTIKGGRAKNPLIESVSVDLDRVAKLVEKYGHLSDY
jgi:hypothetical protein